jgi:two-component system, OmpR family, sensor histidine kinase SenX3
MSNKIQSLDFSTILASSVHDMKNSLAMLLGSIAEIKSDCESESCSIKCELSRIKYEGQRVNRDLIQLLTLYKMDQSQYFLNAEEVNIYDYLEEITLEYQHLLTEHNIGVELRCVPSLSGYFDQELVSSVLKTIINNAYKYANDKIQIKGEESAGYVKLTIEDNGGGYPEHMLFDQPQQKTSSNFGTGSTGLGLYFSAQVASLHKNKGRVGYIQITNQQELNGGCFSIFLP